MSHKLLDNQIEDFYTDVYLNKREILNPTLKEETKRIWIRMLLGVSLIVFWISFFISNSLCSQFQTFLSLFFGIYALWRILIGIFFIWKLKTSFSIRKNEKILLKFILSPQLAHFGKNISVKFFFYVITEVLLGMALYLLYVNSFDLFYMLYILIWLILEILVYQAKTHPKVSYNSKEIILKKDKGDLKTNWQDIKHIELETIQDSFKGSWLAFSKINYLKIIGNKEQEFNIPINSHKKSILIKAFFLFLSQT